MQVHDAIEKMKSHANLSWAQLANVIHLSRAALMSAQSSKNDPRTARLCAIANACGYDVVLKARDDSDSITIDSPTNDDTDTTQ